MITPSFSLTATERVLPKLALDFTTASLDPRVTFTRTTGASNPATYVNSSGVVTAATNNQPRFDYDPVTLVCKGLLIEESRANICLQSQDFTTTWTNAGGGSISGNAATAPDGTLTADALIPTAAATVTLNQAISTTTVPYTFSVFAKANGITSITLASRDNPNVNLASFNLSTGVATLASATSCSIVDYGNGWYRCIATFTPTVAAANRYRIITPLGDGVASVYVWGAQMEAGAFATSYIPTTTTALTRNADVATMTGTNFSDWYNATEGSLYAEGSHQIASGLNLVIAEIGDGTANNIIELYGTNNGNGNAYISSGGSAQATIAVSSTFPANTNGKVAVAFKQNSFQIAGNSALGTSDTSGNMPVSPTAFYIGRYGGNSAYWNGIIKKIMYWPQRLTNAELQAFSK